MDFFGAHTRTHRQPYTHLTHLLHCSPFFYIIYSFSFSQTLPTFTFVFSLFFISSFLTLFLVLLFHLILFFFLPVASVHFCHPSPVFPFCTFICPPTFSSFSLSFSLTSSCLPSPYVSFILNSCFPSSLNISLSPSLLSGGSVWVWKTAIKEMPPLLLGVIIYERGHINVTTANTVCSVHVCVCVAVWVAHDANMAHFVSLSTPPSHTHQILPQGHSHSDQTVCVCVCVCVCVDFGL